MSLQPECSDIHAEGTLKMEKPLALCITYRKKHLEYQ